MDVYTRSYFLKKRLGGEDAAPAHEVVGTVDVQISFESTYERAVENASIKARKIGGDALLLVGGRRPTFDQEAYCLFQVLRYR